MVNDIQVFIVSDENIFETNQQYIRMRELFWEFIIKVWFRTDFTQKKNEDCNRITVKECIKYYIKCWQYRN